MAHYYNKRASPKSFVPGTLVLCNTLEVLVDLSRPKFSLSWESPFVIHKNVGKGCYDLKMVNGDYVFRVNAKVLKIWHVPIAKVIPLPDLFICFVVVRSKKEKKRETGTYWSWNQ